MKFDGQLLSIHIATAGGEAMTELGEATLIEGVGIEGDRYATGRGYYSDRPDIREITLIDEETLACISHHHSTAATLCRALPDFHSVRALNIV